MMSLNLYAILLLIFSIFAFAAFIFVNSKKEMACKKEILILMGTATFWCLTGAMESLSNSLNMKIIWSVVSYLGGQNAAVFLFLFAVSFSQSKSLLNKTKTILLFLIPSVSILLAATNEYHHLVWASILIKDTPLGVNGIYSHGPWFWVESAYGNLLILGSIMLLFTGAFRFSRHYSAEFKLLISVSAFPWAALLFYSYMPGALSLDFVPIAFTFAGIIIIAAIYCYGFLQITPIARNILFENIRDGIIVLDKSGKIIDLNKTAESMLGPPSQEILGRTGSQIFGEIPELLPVTQEVYEDSQLFAHEGKYFKVSKKPLPDNKGNEIGDMIIIYDVTEEKLIENELRQNREELKALVKTKDRFFSIVAHDLKNPFQGLLGYSEILKNDYDQSSESEKKLYISNLYDLAQNTHKMLDNLLEWSRLQMNKIDFNPVPFDLGIMSQKLGTAYSPMARLKRIELIPAVKENTFVIADQNMIRTVIRNLINNAIKFTNIGGEIEILSETKNGWVEIAVKDNGVGIEDSVIDNLFGLDQHRSSRGTGGEEGTGLGLILCKEFIQKNKGTIRVESKIGEGSTFYFTLPADNKMEQLSRL